MNEHEKLKWICDKIWIKNNYFWKDWKVSEVRWDFEENEWDVFIYKMEDIIIFTDWSM